MTDADVQATFCTALVRAWARLGLRDAVIAPGSRSTPMALALATDGGVRVHVAHDERVAGFVALGIGLATGVPAAVLCTSGTAATHLHAAVVEAGLSAVPLLVLTADRPPELHDVGAAQTIDQTRLFGGAPRWFHDPGVAVLSAARSWPALAAQAWAAATGVDPGPVHLNLPMREPLVGTALDDVLAALAQPSGVGPGALAPLPASTLDHLVDLVDGRRGVLVAGRGAGTPSSVGRLAAALGWPVIAEPRSGCRALPKALGAFDSIVRVGPFADGHRPDVVVRLGEPPASKVLAQWLAASGATQILIDGTTRRLDPDHRVELHLAAPVDDVSAAVAARVSAADAAWLDGWLDAERHAQAAITDTLGTDLSEPAVARELTGGALADGTQLVVASSMPVRDVEWYGGPATGVTVHSNRGANGIDGVVATAIGVAVGSGAPTVCLLGDIALCHDASALTGLAARDVDLTIVVVDNDGGAIFSFLAQHDQLDSSRFEQLFGTPHGTDLVRLAEAHHLPATTVTTVEELRAEVTRGGPRLVRVHSDRESNLTIHKAINAAVAQALA